MLDLMQKEASGLTPQEAKRLAEYRAIGLDRDAQRTSKTVEAIRELPDKIAEAARRAAQEKLDILDEMKVPLSQASRDALERDAGKKK